MNLLLDIIAYFKEKDLVVGEAVDAFTDFAPASPDDIVVLNEYQGSPIPTFMQDVSHRSVQILARSADSNVAYEKAWSLFNALKTEDESARIDFTNDRWGQVYLRQSPFKIKLDEQNRVYFGFNIGITTKTE